MKNIEKKHVHNLPPALSLSLTLVGEASFTTLFCK